MLPERGSIERIFECLVSLPEILFLSKNPIIQCGSKKWKLKYLNLWKVWNWIHQKVFQITTLWNGPNLTDNQSDCGPAHLSPSFRPSHSHFLAPFFLFLHLSLTLHESRHFLLRSFLLTLIDDVEGFWWNFLKDDHHKLLSFWKWGYVWTITFSLPFHLSSLPFYLNIREL